MDYVFIPGEVPSSKNSRIKTKNGVFHSKAVKKYLQYIGVLKYNKNYIKRYKTRNNLFERSINGYFDNVKNFPCLIGFHFVRGTKRKFDFANLQHIIADLLVAHGYIEDDNIQYFIPIPLKINGKWFTIDKHNPGVILKIMPDNFTNYCLKEIENGTEEKSGRYNTKNKIETKTSKKTGQRKVGSNRKTYCCNG